MRSQFCRAVAGTLLVGALLVTALCAGAAAATGIAQPKGPYVARLDPQGKPVPFTVVATGFPAGSLVYVEQCDGRPTSAPNWLPTRDCDIGSSPAAAIADSTGTARFPAGDVNHGFPAFAGMGPEGLFSCLAPNAASLKNGLPEYRSCQIRVSSNNNVATADQVLMPFTFVNTAVNGAGTTAVPAATSGSSKSSNSTILVVVAAVVVVALGAIGAFGLRRRRTATAR